MNHLLLEYRSPQAHSSRAETTAVPDGDQTTPRTAIALAAVDSLSVCGSFQGQPRSASRCYGYEVNANTSLPGRAPVIGQPFGAGHAIVLGFDPCYRARTTEGERLVVLLMDVGDGDTGGQSSSEAKRVTAHSRTTARPVPAASSTVNPSGGAPQAPSDRDRPGLGGLPRPR